MQKGIVERRGSDKEINLDERKCQSSYDQHSKSYGCCQHCRGTCVTPTYFQKEATQSSLSGPHRSNRGLNICTNASSQSVYRNTLRARQRWRSGVFELHPSSHRQCTWTKNMGKSYDPRVRWTWRIKIARAKQSQRESRVAVDAVSVYTSSTSHPLDMFGFSIFRHELNGITGIEL